MRAYERLIQYARIHTASSEEGPYRVPSTERQFDLGRLLVQQMQELGVTDARIDEHCYVYGSLPATPGYEQAKNWALSPIWIPSPIFPVKTSSPPWWKSTPAETFPWAAAAGCFLPRTFLLWIG